MAIDGVPTARTYDADGLLTSVGPVQLARAPSSGRLVSTTVGPVSTAYAYSQYGELQSVTTSVSGTVLYSQGLSHDAVGNPLVSEESLSGSTRQESYSYDAVFVEKHLGSARAVVHDSTPCRSGGQTSCSLGRSMTWSLRF
jgi:uncharacterized protein RhaS with RHS repeats